MDRLLYTCTYIQAKLISGAHLSNLVVYNLPVDYFERSKHIIEPEVFILKTCQRTLVISEKISEYTFHKLKNDAHEVIIGEKSYRFLLEVICGLKSHLVGESEIVSQFKEAFDQYLKNTSRSTKILLTLQKLFKDAKEVRSNFLNEVGQYSYAGITKKLIVNRGNGPQVLIIGSGQLAEDIIKVLNKRFNIHLIARNKERMKILSEKYQVTTYEWENIQEARQYASIINTVGIKKILFNHDFFKTWLLLHGAKGLFIDLGSPSSIKTDYDVTNGVIRLDDIFQMSDRLNKEKMEKVEFAQKGIKEIVSHRWERLARKANFDKEESPTHEQTATI